ncbi:PP2C family serine/threonine-protein phosphatase [Pseudomaricurvus sp. HS19]|uniref:PP2C family protein-serine/threonine phosphatase n=1 Tax=Pseudomaricurvus sp. HS19 TaxID=2692626 RepID=UPI00136B6C7F|nr:protein phosphatase 2C domain-containing protein [Pseudomaricurvus sp. HS19]MYM62115.1 serine/threonine-protein phosphatase [Pseudomaricurvus sp. HS19]
MPPLQSYSLTNKGLVRDNNEDCFLSRPDQGFWMVADGMGGHDAGEVASDIVKRTIDEKLPGSRDLESAIHSAHKAVLKAASRGEGANGMGSTVVALLSDDTDYQVSWVGDSRAYLWSEEGDGGRLEQLTTDHSYVQMLLASGAIQAEEVDDHPDKNVITQCIGSSGPDPIKVDTVRGNWEQQQWIVLCSDGLTDELDNSAIAQILCHASTPREATQKLMQQALTSGGRDNITVQVIESPLFRRNLLHRLNEWLPRVTGRLWLDLTLYGLALVSTLMIGYWTIT